jgi:hypothetical protein
MFRAVLHRVRVAVDRLAGRDGHATDSDDAGDNTSRFVPSPLDASVRYAHGGSGDDIDRELADIEEEARRLDEHGRRK